MARTATFEKTSNILSYLNNLKKVSYYHLRQLVSEGYLIAEKKPEAKKVIGSRGRMPIVYKLTPAAKKILANYKEENKSHLIVLQEEKIRFCHQCGIGHSKPNIHFCSDECKKKNKEEKNKKELDIKNEIAYRLAKEKKQEETKERDKEKKKIAAKKYRDRNQDKIKEQQKLWREANPDYSRAYARQAASRKAIFEIKNTNINL